ncbi:MAG: sulfotransferase domain-containing protein [Alphaproteobacteria bacterium]|nr:sulfotransferase domain-containing protein [Alphaproteobacteria bacterium]
MQQATRTQKPAAIYKNHLTDSTRWENFKSRDGDVFVCTPAKCGTTWAQMICALLIFQKPEFERPLSDYTPWLDMLLYPIDKVLAKLEAQTHRRFIKTHTPFDGLPYYENTTYLCVGRDPRDAFLSMGNHSRNISPEFLKKFMANAKPEEKSGEPEMKLTVGERFLKEITAPAIAGSTDNPAGVLPYVKSFWDYRHLPNLHFMHYSDMKRDLGGEMRRVAAALGIEVAEKLWPVLIRAAEFENMKKNSDRLAPDAETGIWKEPGNFFNKGENGQWREIFSAEELAGYEKVMRERLDPELANWIENGRLG